MGCRNSSRKRYGSNSYRSSVGMARRPRMELLEIRRLLSGALPDLSFGTGGKVLTDLPNSSDDRAIGATLQTGDKTLILTSGGMARYNVSGSPDASFGVGGIVNISAFRPAAIALRSDNSIVVAGYVGAAGDTDQFAIAHYSAAGAIDTSFGSSGNGMVINDLYGGINTYAETISKILVQPDDKIIVAGSASTLSYGFEDDFAVSRYNADGSPDLDFGNSFGSTTLADFGGYDHLSDIALLPGGDLIAVGDTAHNSSHHPYSRQDFALARFKASGGLDTSFGGGDGMATDNFGSYLSGHPFAESPNNAFDIAQSVSVQPDGRFVVAGRSYNAPDDNNQRVAIARYGADGTLDPTFSPSGSDPDSGHSAATGGPGHLLISSTADHVQVVRESNGLLLLGATVVDSSGSGDFGVLAQLSADGDTDPTFTAARANFGGDDQLSNLLVTSDGKLIAAGGSRANTSATNWKAALARFNVVNPLPFGETPISLPGVIEAENFDLGGEGVAYHDTTPFNSRPYIRTSEAVDIDKAEDYGGGYFVGWIQAGEWLDYSVNVPVGGTFEFDFRVASSNSGGKFRVEVDGVPRLTNLVVPNTGGWQNWSTLRSSQRVQLSAGEHLLRVFFESNGGTGSVGNLNSITVRKVDTTGVPAAPGPLSGGGILEATRLNVHWQDNTDNETLYKIERKTGDAGAWEQIGTLPANSTDFLDTGLTPGTRYIYRVRASNAFGDSPYSMEFPITTPVGGQAPYAGAPIALPAVIQAENFDSGGESIAYHDLTPLNQGDDYRLKDAVDIQPTSGTPVGHNVGWVQAGEWLEYTANVPAGTFNINFRVASLGRGGTFHLEQDGVNKTGAVAIPDTGGWQKWQTIVVPNVTMSASANSILKVVFDTPGSTLGYVGNLDWFGFELSAGNTGLSATYYDTDNLTGPASSQTVADIDFNWGTGSPLPSIAPDTFSARFDGFLQAAETGNYTLYTKSDDGVRLWVDNQLLIDDWTRHSTSEKSATMRLEAGRKYAIRLEYFNAYGSANVQLSWSSASVPKQVIPAAAFTTA